MSVPTSIRIGTSGWNYRDWRGRFYPTTLPTRDWISYYQNEFDTVEINNTFYRLPAPAQFESWRQKVSGNFLFAVKASRYLTHMKKLKDAVGPLRRLVGRAKRLDKHLGPILYQLPPHWKPDLVRLDEFCRRLPSHLTHVIEFREMGWLTKDTFRILEKYGVCLCIYDLLNRHPRQVTGTAAYVRFHGVGSRYGGSYSHKRLSEWANWMRATAARGRTVYAYFNNDLHGFAVANARTLRNLVRHS